MQNNENSSKTMNESKAENNADKNEGISLPTGNTGNYPHGRSAIITLPGNIELELVKIPAGSFQMGSPESEEERCTDENLHGVTLTCDYWLGKYEVTQEQYKAVMKDNPSYFKKGGRYPVEMVKWDDAVKFCGELNRLMKGKLPSGYEFNLPTEAQWEYACRAGTTTPFSFGTLLNGREANCDGQFPYGTCQEGPYLGKTSLVGSYRANAWGLYDMHGNVWEWCRDWYESNYADDPEYLRGQKKGKRRVLRGGCWFNSTRHCRSAERHCREPSSCFCSLGFRLALVPVP